MSISLSMLLFISIVGVYLAVIEIFTVLFRITGLSQETAHYQSISLLTSCGFTTSESEIILASKHRRHIAKWAMLFGYMFSVILATSIINLIVSITLSGREGITGTLFLIVIAPVIFILLFRFSSAKRVMDLLIKKIVESIFMQKTLVNPFYILEMYGDEAICELLITHVPSEIAGKTIFESGVRNKYGINYISIVRENQNHMIEPFTDVIQKNDKIVICGNPNVIGKVFKSSIDLRNETY